MKIEILTHADVLRHTSARVLIAVCSTLFLTAVMIAIMFGSDPETNIRLGEVARYDITIGAVIAASLTSGLAYRSGLLMQQLSLARAELQLLSRTDQLTGLLNRRGYDEAAGKALAKADEANIPAVALMCDIDRFKAINDEFGHEFGDKVLVEIGEAIRVFGEEKGLLVARHGGEEFAALMIGVTIEQAVQHANALRAICAATKVLGSGGSSARVTVSIGLASSQENIDLPEIMRAADRALYTAKHGGRNRVARIESGCPPPLPRNSGQVYLTPDEPRSSAPRSSASWLATALAPEKMSCTSPSFPSPRIIRPLMSISYQACER